MSRSFSYFYLLRMFPGVINDLNFFLFSFDLYLIEVLIMIISMELFLCVCVCACMFYLLKDINLEILINYAVLYGSYSTKLNYSLSRIKRKYWSRSGISSQKLLPLYCSTIENKSMFLSGSQAFGIFCILSRLQGTVKSVEFNLFGFKLIYQKEGQLNTKYQPFVFSMSFHSCTTEMSLKNNLTHWMFPGP